MTYQEEFIAWRDANPQASEEEQRVKLHEVKATYEGGKRNIQRAKEMFPDDKFIPAMEQGPEQFRDELDYQKIPQTTRSMYPRVSRSMARGEMFNPVAGITDVSSGLGRLAESASYKAQGGEQPFAERMEQTDDNLPFASQMLRDPMLPFSAATGGAPASQVGTGIYRKGLEYLGKTAMLEGGHALGSQAEQMSRGQDFSAGEAIGEAAIATALPFGMKASKEAIGGSKEFAKNLISEASNRTRELLDIIGPRELKQGLKHKMKKAGETVKPDEVLQKYSSFAENAEKAAQGIIKTVDDIDITFRKNNKIVDEAISQMPPIDTKDIVGSLLSMRKATPATEFSNMSTTGLHKSKGFKNEIAFNNQIDGLVNKIRFLHKKSDPNRTASIMDRRSSFDAEPTTISADEFLELRREIDNTIDWDAETFSKSYRKPIQKLKKDIRTKMKNTLLDEADKIGNKGYSKAMRDLHKTIQVKEGAQRLLMPKLKDIDELDRSQKFLLQLSNPNQLAKRKWAAKFKEATGYDLLADADLLRMSREYRGTLPMVNDYRTGAKNFAANFLNIPLVGGAVGAVAGSPRIGAAMYGAMDAGERMYGEGLDKLSRYAPSLRTTQRSAIQQGIGE